MSAPRKSGFTLVELMLAILILAIMMSIVYGVVVSTVSAAKRVEEITASSEIGPALLTRIRADLEAAFLPKEGEFFVGSKRPGGGADRDRIDFISSDVAYGSENDVEEPRFHSINEVGYQVLDSRKDPNVGILYRREDFFIDAEPLKGGRLTEMYDRVRGFSLRYYDGKEWRADWSSKTQKGLPKAVEIELRLLVTNNDDPNHEQKFKTTVMLLH
ncbi:MAG: prepilin-type N-terminal cleavage/methylation domain-containing protein [Planctomycetaceae bacterium]|nr:prepilin-type N-terminal cleavage/methylation domain-containing protein [Planctomycetaceae bacterium]